MAEADLEETVRRWRVAEERLYPVVMLRPEVYQRYIELVRAVADELWSYVTPESLVAAYAKAPEIVAAVIARFGTAVDDLDVGLLAGAAFSLRYREVVADRNRKEAVERLEAARARGDEWVVLYETGRRPAGRPPIPPYRRLEMHLPDGLGLHVFVEVDPETANPVYGVERVRLDPATGDWVDEGETDAASRQSFPTPERWQSAVEALRQLYRA